MEKDLRDGGVVPAAFTEQIDEFFGLKERDWGQYSALSLAFLGDAVFEMVVRSILVKRSDVPSARLHQRAARIVCAGSQAKMMRAIVPHLTKEEEALHRRGHNAKPPHTAKNASREDYLEATALEALIGYLYLKKEYSRILELIRLGLRLTENHNL